MNKTCTGCNIDYPETDEFYNRVSKGNNKFRTKCKRCEKNYRTVNKDRIVKSQKEYRIENHDKISEVKKQYSRNNAKKLKDYINEWSKKNIDHLIEYRKKYIAEHKKHKQEYDKEHSKIYRDAHKEEKKASTRNRRAKIKQSHGSHTAADIKKQYETQGGKCYWCGASVGNIYHVDHVVPITRGGSNDPSNLVIACPSCNMSKGAKLPHEWSNRIF